MLQGLIIQAFFFKSWNNVFFKYITNALLELFASRNSMKYVYPKNQTRFFWQWIWLPDSLRKLGHVSGVRKGRRGPWKWGGDKQDGDRRVPGLTASILPALVPFPEEELPARYLDAVRMLRGNFFFMYLKKIFNFILAYSWWCQASLVDQMVKNPPAMWETWVQSLGWEDALEEGMETHSSILAWRIPRDRGAWWATVHGVAQSWTDWQLSAAQHIVDGRCVSYRCTAKRFSYAHTWI